MVGLLREAGAGTHLQLRRIGHRAEEIADLVDSYIDRVSNSSVGLSGSSVLLGNEIL